MNNIEVPLTLPLSRKGRGEFIKGIIIPPLPLTGEGQGEGEI